MSYYTCRVYSSRTEQRCTVLEDLPKTLREAAKKVSMDIKCVSAHPLVVAVTPRAYPTAKVQRQRHPMGYPTAYLKKQKQPRAHPTA